MWSGIFRRRKVLVTETLTDKNPYFLDTEPVTAKNLEKILSVNTLALSLYVALLAPCLKIESK